MIQAPAGYHRCQPGRQVVKAIHTALLGIEPHTDESYYVGFNVGGIEIGLSPQGPEISPIAYVGVDDLDASIEGAKAAGATVAEEPHDVGGGTRLATVTDPDGNTLGLIQRS